MLQARYFKRIHMCAHIRTHEHTHFYSLTMGKVMLWTQSHSVAHIPWQNYIFLSRYTKRDLLITVTQRLRAPSWVGLFTVIISRRCAYIKKTLMLGDWGQEEKGATEDEMVGCHHRLKGHDFKQILEDSEGQESLVCWSLCGHREWDMT